MNNTLISHITNMNFFASVECFRGYSNYVKIETDCFTFKLDLDIYLF